MSPSFYDANAGRGAAMENRSGSNRLRTSQSESLKDYL